VQTSGEIVGVARHYHHLRLHLMIPYISFPRIKIIRGVDPGWLASGSCICGPGPVLRFAPLTKVPIPLQCRHAF
jgi:hypothetical protein